METPAVSLPVIVDLKAECQDASLKSAHDRSVVLEPTVKFFDRELQIKPIRLKGTGTRHFYIVDSGVIDSMACIQTTRSNEIYIVSNGLQVIFQEKSNVFLLRVEDAKINNLLTYHMARLNSEGEPVDEVTGKDFSSVWKGAMTKVAGEYKERPGFVLKEAKLQQAFDSQLKLLWGEECNVREKLRQALMDLVSADQPVVVPAKKPVAKPAAASTMIPPPPTHPPSSPPSSPLPSSFVKPVHQQHQPKTQFPVLNSAWPPYKLPNLLPATSTWMALKKSTMSSTALSSSFAVAVWRSVLSALVLDPEHEEVEAWCKLPEFEATAIEVMQKSSTDPHEAFVASLNYGIILYISGKFSQALGQFTSIQQSLDVLEATLLLRWLGRANMKLGNYAQAESLMDQVSHYFSDIQPIPSERAVSNSDLAWVSHDRANGENIPSRRIKLIEDSIGYFTKAIELREKAPEHVCNRDSLRLLAGDYYGRSIMTALITEQLDKAEQDVEMAYKCAKQVYGDKEDTDVMSRIKRGLGLVAIRQAQHCQDGWAQKHALFVKGIALLEEAKTIRTGVKGENHSQVANLMSLISVAKKHQSQLFKKPSPEYKSLQEEATRYRNTANEIWNNNGVAPDHAWRRPPKEFDLEVDADGSVGLLLALAQSPI
ncbi:hypothetical protein BASA81_004740 [Batrachochytrium salamandrivorans]|nr:hypothetical protein BASA81_004740 [Batrachochytrium salamandrivorans]